ncbi:hypothetical protein ACP7IB_000811 [Vibrio cholerae]|nr:hypothetical protein [Vibrio cholerae]EKF9648274.1 hypothetical protein [Vibrio cholerae]EKF9651481.1 hypothetical protein [Vibrio cholerae]ELL0575774.1 hypothetical protein [Vibrio cholerae]GHZ62042.1 hypothetical protein VCSRO175_1126 [Vibrio cholerae]
MRTLFGLWVICYSNLLFANAQPNDEKLVSALIEQGIICEGLSYEQQQKALSLYLQQRFNNKNNDINADSESSSSGENPELKPRCINPESP